MCRCEHPANRVQIVGINAETVTNIPSTDFPGHWPGESHEWSLERFKRVRSPNRAQCFSLRAYTPCQKSRETFL